MAEDSVSDTLVWRQTYERENVSIKVILRSLRITDVAMKKQ
jgi:hypothetical protein